MARYIDADRLRDRVKTETNPYGKPTLEYASGLKVLVMIDKEPTADVVEVVRCEKCKHLTIHNSMDLYAFCEKTKYRFRPFQTDTRTHFCSYGERKE